MFGMLLLRYLGYIVRVDCGSDAHAYINKLYLLCMSKLLFLMFW